MNTNGNRLTAEELQELRKTNFSMELGFEQAETVLAREVGSPKREEFDAKACAWYYDELFRECRKELGMMQKELAERVNREHTYINRVERGEIDLQLSSFIRIASAPGVMLRLDVNPA